MSITLETLQLRAVAQEVAAVAAGGAVPIFANVLIREGEGGKVRWLATDLDVWIERDLQAVSGTLAREPLRATVSAKLLSSIAAKLPGEAQVSLEHDGGKIKVACGRSKFTLPTLPVEDFPTLAANDWAAQFDLPASVVRELIDRLAFAISADETRYYLGGIYLHRVTTANGAMLRAATTDGHRLARAQVKLPEGAEDIPEAGIILPRRATALVRKLVDHMKPGTDDAPQLVGIALNDRRIMFDLGEGEHGETRFTSKLIDGTFPDYARVIPTANDKLLTIDKASLVGAVERVSVISTEKARAVKVVLTKDLVTLSVTSPEAGDAVEEVAASFTGSDLTMGFNARYMLEVLNRIDGATVVVELGDDKAPSLWRDADEADALFVLMPLRV